MIIKVGCCGFSKSKKEYFKNFSIVELQSTFYDLPKNIETVEKWREEAPKDFEFSLKAWQVITHEISSPTYKRMKTKFGNVKNYGNFKNSKEVFEAWERIREMAKILKARVIVFQCPPSFSQTNENIKNIRNFFGNIERNNFLFALEIRGKWDEKVLKEICKEFNLVHCVDPFKQKSLHGNINYFRLHGKNGYNLSYVYTEKDFEEILSFCTKKENYVLFNNIEMYSNALQFKSYIKKCAGTGI